MRRKRKERARPNIKTEQRKKELETGEQAR